MDIYNKTRGKMVAARQAAEELGSRDGFARAEAHATRFSGKEGLACRLGFKPGMFSSGLPE